MTRSCVETDERRISYGFHLDGICTGYGEIRIRDKIKLFNYFPREYILPEWHPRYGTLCLLAMMDDLIEYEDISLPMTGHNTLPPRRMQLQKFGITQKVYSFEQHYQGLEQYCRQRGIWEAFKEKAHNRKAFPSPWDAERFRITGMRHESGCTH